MPNRKMFEGAEHGGYFDRCVLPSVWWPEAGEAVLLAVCIHNTALLQIRIHKYKYKCKYKYKYKVIYFI